MNLLLTNDDGINAPGLLTLAQRLHADGHELTLVAPLHETSGSGTSVGSQLDGTLVIFNLVELPGLEGVRAMAIDGPPALAVLAVCHSLIDVKPDLVISGINPGNNIGRLSHHSGTLGAATTAAAYGLRAVAVSCPAAPGERYKDAACFISVAVGPLATRAPDGVVFNINYPAREFKEVRGVRAGSLALPLSGDLVLEREPGGFRLRVSRDRRTVADNSDLALLDEGYISVTTAGDGGLETGAGDEISRILDGLMDDERVARHRGRL